MSQCKILSFQGIFPASRHIKPLTDPRAKGSTAQLRDYPIIEEEINAYLREGYAIQRVFYDQTPSMDHDLFVILVK